MYVKRHVISATTDASGDFTGYTDVTTGAVLQIRYVPDATSPLATGADLDITCEQSGVVISDKDDIGTSAFTVATRQASHSTAHVASAYASGGEAVLVPIVVSEERIKLVIAQGGDTKSGTFHIYVGG